MRMRYWICRDPPESLRVSGQDRISLPVAAADILHVTALKKKKKILSIPSSPACFFSFLLCIAWRFESLLPHFLFIKPIGFKCFSMFSFLYVFHTSLLKSKLKSVRQHRPMVSNCHHQEIYTLLRFDPVTIGRANSTKSSIRTGHAPKIKMLVNHVTSSQCSRHYSQLSLNSFQNLT